MSDDVLTHFDQAVARLKQAYLDLDHCLSSTHVVSHRTRHQAGVGASDIVTFCITIFKDAHADAVNRLTESSHILGAAIFNPQLIKKGLNVSSDACSKLIVSYKALFYFVRAYQDALYKVMLEIEGQSPGYGSMATASQNPRNKVAEILNIYLPEYKQWFINWKKKRDDVKLGANFSISGPEEILGISFVTVNEDSGGIVIDCSESKAVRISDIVEAINFSAKLATVASQRAKERHL